MKRASKIFSTYTNVSKASSIQPIKIKLDWMKTIYTFLLLISISFASQAQNIIKGMVIDNENKSPLSYATVSLHTLPDSASIRGMISATDGTFAFNNLKPGNYFCKIKFMGYSDFKSNSIALDGSIGTKELGQIVLSPASKNLKEVEVVGERLKGVEAVDRTVYTISEQAAKTAGNGIDIMKRIPAVQVDLSNNISLQGSSNIIILVDGKERDNNFVAQLDPKSIDKVEVSTNPSAKYDASITGVINIILKKENRRGISGNIDLEIPTNNSHYISSTSGGLDFGYNKLRVFTSFNSHFEGFPVYKDFERNSGNNTFTAKGMGDFYHHSATLHYGFDYFFNAKNTLSFYANYNPSVNNMQYLYQKYIYNNDQLARYYTTDNNENSKYAGQYRSLFYKKGFKKDGHEISADLGYFTSKTTNKNTFLDQYYLTDMVTPEGDESNRFEIVKPKRQSLNTKIDYKLPVNDKLMLEAGYQNYFQVIKSSYDGSSDNSDFKFKESRNAAYLQVGNKIGKWNLRAGVRYEFSKVNIDDISTSEYDCLLPNATIQYNAGKGQNIKLNYRRSIQRPGMNDLNPYTVMYDSMNMVTGNPFLKPAYNDKFQLNYSLNAGSNYFGPEIYYTRKSDVFQSIVTVNDNNVMQISTSNLGKGYEYGIGFSGSINATKWLLLNPYARLYRQHVSGYISSVEEKFNVSETNHTAWQASLYAMAKLPKGFAVWTYANYSSPSINMQSTNYRDCLYLIGVEKNMMKDKGKIGLNWYVPFKNTFRFNRNVTETALVYQDDDNYVGLNTLVSLKFTYKFSKGKEVKKLNRQTNAENDSKGGIN